MNSSNLIVISNRLPFTLKRGPDGSLCRVPAAGGLVTAVAPVVIETNGTWIGWAGPGLSEGEIIPESLPSDHSPTAGLKSGQIRPVNLTDWEFQMYYNGCCNATLWPLFHSMPDKAIFNQTYWLAYKTVNQKFAQATLNDLRKNHSNSDTVGIVWIQDYHLLLAATIIRQAASAENLNCKICFFLHIPFPTWDMVKILPWNREVIQALLDCDLVGFHVDDYCLNFVDCCRRGLGCKVEPGTKGTYRVNKGGRCIRVMPHPISIPFSRFEDLADKAEQTLCSDTQVILGVDRLDYTKGLVNRFKAFEILLSTHPEYINNVVLLQVAVPSRTDVQEYQDLKDMMDQLVGRINGKFSTAYWSPIRYIYGSLSHSQLAGIYRDSDVGLITPLRDGMNLVAKEFVACRTRKPGVLILSPFAGAGEMMKEALLVNPYELETVAETIHRALQMPENEREARMNALRSKERVNNVEQWMAKFIQAISELIQEDGKEISPSDSLLVQAEDFQGCLGEFIEDGFSLALLLDFDGTLSPLVSNPKDAALPSATKDILVRLSQLPNVFIGIVSGRGVEDVMSKVGIPGITYAGNHGLNIIHPDQSTYNHPIPENLEGRTQTLLRQIEEECCVFGATVENKGVIVTWHYRNVPTEKREPLISKVKNMVTKAGFKIGTAHCALESKPDLGWDKGKAAMLILKNAFGKDWPQKVRVIYVGDDVTDEDAMRDLKGLGFSFKISSSTLSMTNADRILPGTDSVVKLLEWVEDTVVKRSGVDTEIELRVEQVQREVEI